MRLTITGLVCYDFMPKPGRSWNYKISRLAVAINYRIIEILVVVIILTFICPLCSAKNSDTALVSGSLNGWGPAYVSEQGSCEESFSLQ